MVNYIFVYGTLKYNNIMSELFCKEVGIAITKNKYLMVIKSGIPFIIPAKKLPENLKSSTVNVKGVLYELPKNKQLKKEAFEYLDFYEGVPTLYERKIISVEKDNIEYKSYAYIPSNRTIYELLSLIKSGTYIEINKSGWY